MMKILSGVLILFVLTARNGSAEEIGAGNVTPAAAGNETDNVAPAAAGNETDNVAPVAAGNGTDNVTPAAAGNETDAEEPEEEEYVCPFAEQHICSVIRTLSRQLMLQQLYVDERVRTEGDSGIKQVRVLRHTTVPYLSESYTGRGFLAMHDHADNERTLGMGEFELVMNGNEFRTRHNDYKLVTPDTDSNDLHKTKPLEYPPVPPSVLAKDSIEEQSIEMRKYFKAWAEQNDTEYDYKPYFQVALCYLEGAWFKSHEKFDEPFPSDRHFVNANSWEDLENKIMYTSYAGNKDGNENLSFLPKKIMGLVNDTFPLYAQWNYRILCHKLMAENGVEPLDLPFNHFHVVDDFATRMAAGQTMEQYQYSRNAHFKLFEDDKYPEKYQQLQLIDKFMEQIPGKDNYPAFLEDNAFGAYLYSEVTNEPLNAAHYHRMSKVIGKDASGRMTRERGYCDQNLFVAMNNQSQVVGQTHSYCSEEDPTDCHSFEQKFSYAIPLEIVYLTPLQTWNPYEVFYYEDRFEDEVTEEEKRDGLKEECPLRGSHPKHYFQTPQSFFSDAAAQADPADTNADGVFVRDGNGTVQKMLGSGVRIFMPAIDGVDREVRTRYPIAPIYFEGNTVFKELDALKRLVLNPARHPSMGVSAPAAAAAAAPAPAPAPAAPSASSAAAETAAGEAESSASEAEAALAAALQAKSAAEKAMHAAQAAAAEAELASIAAVSAAKAAPPPTSSGGKKKNKKNKKKKGKKNKQSA